MAANFAARANQALIQSSPKWRLAIWLLLMLSASLWTLQLWQNGARVQSDILAMLPHLQQDKLTERALNQVEATLADQVYIALVAKDETTAIAAAKLLIQKLETDLVTGRNAVLTEIRSADMQLGEALGQYYFPHRFKLLTAPQAEALATKDIGNLIEAATAQLYNAFSYANSNLLAQDPLLLFPANLLALAPSSKVKASQGILLANQGDNVAAVVMAKGQESAFNPNAQLAQMTALTLGLDAVKQSYPDITLLKAGALFHAIAATQTAKSEISILGLASLLGVIALVWLAFRSVMPLLLAIVTISSGLLLAVTLTLSVFGELHLLTLVFGTSLIGIAIDYSFHFYCERLSDTERSAQATVAYIFPTVTLAFITSALAYVGIGLAPFPGMQQVAIFCAAGLLGAYLTLILAYPLLAGSRLPSGSRPLALAGKYLANLTQLSNRLTTPLGMGMFALVIVVWCLVGVTKLTVDDDIRHLQQSPVSVTEPENKLRQLLSGGTDNQFLLVRAASEEALLQQLERVSPMLNAAITNQELGNYVSLSRYLPSHQRQDTAYRLQGEIYQNQIDTVLTSLGLDENLKPELQASYLAAKEQYISPADFFTQEAGKQLAPLWLAPNGKATDYNVLNDGASAEYGAIVLLGGIKQIDAIKARFANDQSVQLIDKVADISAVMGHYRLLTLKLLALALGIALLLFSLNFGIKKAAVVVAVPALAALLTLATLGLTGSPLSLFHALALILVFGIGIDYSLFFASAQQHGKAVMMAVFMSACSTLLAFGLLAFSQTQAIHYFGLTLSLGIGFTFLLSPLILTTKKS
ncbi:MMPL family transporter [Shewanella sp. JNE10-2]|uniref:MMPL family transporter n=1 Tax=unclassified Shewanella TaxID=196818 RepID=UPI002006D2FF|nr:MULTISPECIES: MMPL family transporter [unclassified Shewanella]MCK7631911.1 MMPL family transporter [Shewanella sp. JNE9-1]MCK7636104.1 MMPL family transporter [Shewanella sp. JNE17]MCK7647083.1 MMPL family transporter [Shewanella sp. JNE3-1]MCK7651281.1 MMPL family transporter [Shewanella sp. JNE8]MCK7655220.1 MMPL family transporter [Shewanella sp. JNE4-1]